MSASMVSTRRLREASGEMPPLSAKARGIIDHFRKSLSWYYWGGRDCVQIDVGVFEGRFRPDDYPSPVFQVQLFGDGMIERAIAGVSKLVKGLDPTAQNLVVDDEEVGDAEDDGGSGDEGDADGEDTGSAGVKAKAGGDGAAGSGDPESDLPESCPLLMQVCEHDFAKTHEAVTFSVLDNDLPALRQEVRGVAAKYATRLAARLSHSVVVDEAAGGSALSNS